MMSLLFFVGEVSVEVPFCFEGVEADALLSASPMDFLFNFEEPFEVIILDAYNCCFRSSDLICEDDSFVENQYP